MLLYALQPLSQQLAAGYPDAHGQRINKQPDHRLYSGQLCRTAGHRSSVDDITLAAVAIQQQGPTALDHSINSQLVLSGERVQRSRQLWRQFDLHLFIVLSLAI